MGHMLLRLRRHDVREVEVGRVFHHPVLSANACISMSAYCWGWTNRDGMSHFDAVGAAPEGWPRRHEAAFDLAISALLRIILPSPAHARNGNAGTLRTPDWHVHARVSDAQGREARPSGASSGVVFSHPAASEAGTVLWQGSVPAGPSAPGSVAPSPVGNPQRAMGRASPSRSQPCRAWAFPVPERKRPAQRDRLG